MALPYLYRSVDTSVVTSYEALKAVPTWRADETVFSFLVTLRELTLKDVIIQMRSEPDELIELAKRGLLDQFYEGEIAIRKALGYPPYSTFILLSFKGTKEETKSIEESIAKHLQGSTVQFYSAPQSNSTQTLRYGLLRLTSTAQQMELTPKLRTLPPYIKVEVNPDRIV